MDKTMSVRKLALAALTRVDSLRQSLVEHPTPIVRGMALAAGLAMASGPGVAVAEFTDHLPSKDPAILDADYQWFEPLYDADILDMKPKKRAHTGWFGSVDRLQLWTTRPDNADGDWVMDRGTGYRLDLGYMLDNDHGYSVTYTDFRVGSYDAYDRERLNRLVPLDDEGVPEDIFLGPPFGLPSIQEDGNNFGYNYRFVPMRDSENVADFRSFEANKTWRLEPYHYGGILEPLIGVRYMRFADVYQRMEYTPGLFLPPVFDPIDPDLLAGEQVITERSVTNNDMIGGQIGFRYFKHINRWRYSGEFRIFNAASFQSNKLQSFSETTLYDDTEVEPGSEIRHFIRDQSRPLYGKNTEFAWGYDIRSELSYTLTRMIEVRGGFQLIDIASGVWRGRLIDPTSNQDQRALMAGFTFGVALNR